jgi:hypothetical protein
MFVNLATTFRAHTQVNVYVSFGDAPGFGLHWDDHDVLVVQLDGRKYWEVRRPLDVGPLKGITPGRQGGDAVWSGVMEPGAAIYIPRGWAHGVRGLADERSVHLTFGFRRANAVDTLGLMAPSWFTGDFSYTPHDLEHGIGSWRASIAATPRHGPIEHIEARSAQFRGWQIGMPLLSGAVFLPGRCDRETLVLSGNNRVFTVRRKDASAFAHLLESGWSSIDDLADHLPHENGVGDFLDELGSHGLIALRREQVE